MTRNSLWAAAVVLFLILSGCRFGEVRKDITFTWAQSPNDLANLKEWRIKYATRSGGPYTLWDTIIFLGPEKLEYLSFQPVSAIPGGPKNRLYFIVTAVGKNDAESSPSNEVVTDIDFLSVTIPIKIKISVY